MRSQRIRSLFFLLLWLGAAFLSYAEHRRSGDANTVEAAAFLAYRLDQTHGGDVTIAKRTLLLLTEALARQKNELARSELLSVMERAYPDDTIIRGKLARASKTFGVRVVKLATHPNQFPTNACVTLNLKPKGGRPSIPARSALTGILFVLLAGIPWGMLPREMHYGSGVTCWRRLRDWQKAGVWDRLHRDSSAMRTGSTGAAPPWIARPSPLKRG